MDNTYIESIYRKYLDNTATLEERRQFVEWVKVPENETVIKELLLATYYESIYEIDSVNQTDDQTVNGMIEAILLADKPIATPTSDLKSAADSFSEANYSIPPLHRVLFLRRSWFRYAAAIILLVGAAVYYWTSIRTTHPLEDSNGNFQEDIAPGGNKAILTLSDGRNLSLDSMANGAIAAQGNTSIIKLNNGELRYDVIGVSNGDIMMNTITTPRGGQYQLSLPDGTKAWLNAESSITYPASFSGNERNVSITGEVYMEVSRILTTPFIVTSRNASVLVLGTSFNISAYPEEESQKTTLISGAVKVIYNNQQMVLKPGEVAELNQKIKVSKADIEHTIAWKMGLFSFNNADLRLAMRQLERWYDVKVQYEGQVPNITIDGEMFRNVGLNEVLQYLKDAGLKYRQEGKIIIIL